MVETRRSDEPLVETVDPDALARRHGGRASGGAVPERGRKQAARSPERIGDSVPRHPSYLEETLAQNGVAWYSCLTALGFCALLSALFTPVALADFTFVAAVWSYLGLATLLRFPRKQRVEQPGPYPFRPMAAPPIRGFVDQFQLLMLASLATPTFLIATSRLFKVKFASDQLRESVASALFLQLMQLLTEALCQWPFRLAPPVWLTIPALFGAARMRSLLNWFGASRGDALFPRISNRLGFSALKWAFRRKSSAEWMLALTRFGALSGLAVAIMDVLIVLPLVEAAAFMDARYLHQKPALHAALEPGAGRESVKSD